MPAMERRNSLIELQQLDTYLFEIPQSFRSDMRVPARLYAACSMLDVLQSDRSLQQLVNVATLPGIQKYAVAMPDIHQGYGFPIGGVAATLLNHEGVISPGGIGYDINCGVRLLISNNAEDEIKRNIPALATALQQAVPSGVGQPGFYQYSFDELDLILREGARAMVRYGYGIEDDLVMCEDEGVMAGAEPAKISAHAKKRASNQLGTLGSGNHFLEVQVVDEIYDAPVAEVLGLREGYVSVMIHCGSRGLGHQVCTDYVRLMDERVEQFGYHLADRELACAPCDSQEGLDYFGAMAAAANFAWANRHMIAHAVRTTWQDIVGRSSNLRTVYDVCHNIGKREIHEIDGKNVSVMVHRKGATQALGPGSVSIPLAYRDVGQPVLIPGTMGTASYVLVGRSSALAHSFASSCHGAGRSMSRAQAKQMMSGHQVRKRLEKQGITVRCGSLEGLAEEAPEAYKDVHTVIDVVQNAGLAAKVARLRPIAVIKG